VIRYTWNVLSYDLTTPLELKETEAWKYIVVLSECSLYLVEYLRGGGALRKLGGNEID
jgi:cytochrome c oxidase subunit IV